MRQSRKLRVLHDFDPRNETITTFCVFMTLHTQSHPTEVRVVVDNTNLLRLYFISDLTMSRQQFDTTSVLVYSLCLIYVLKITRRPYECVSGVYYL